jgi:hypothetical protein
MTTFTRNGFPWNPAWPAWHATTALSSILKHGFKTRSEVSVQATGGGTDKAVSLTLDPRVAFAIAVNLEVIRNIGRGVITLRELYLAAQQECPRGLQHVLEYRHQTADDLEKEIAGLKWLSTSDWLSFNPPIRPPGRWDTPPSFAVDPVANVGGWWVPLEKYPWKYEPWSYHKTKRGYLYHEAFEFYKQLLALGEGKKECYNPLFFMSDLDQIAAIPYRDLGVVEVTVDVNHVCLDAQGAWVFGYLTKQGAYTWEHFLHDEQYSCEQVLDRPDSADIYNKDRYGWPRDKIGGFDVAQTGDRKRTETMVYLPAMAELRVYAPKKIHVTDAIDVTDVRALTGIGNRITFPYFDTRPYGGR